MLPGMWAWEKAALLGALMFGGSRFGELAARTGAPPTVLSY